MKRNRYNLRLLLMVLVALAAMGCSSNARNQGGEDEEAAIHEWNLILEDEINLPRDHSAMNCSSPAICVEHDGDVTISYFEWGQKPEDRFPYHFFSEGYKSEDDGDTWPHNQYQMNIWSLYPIVFGFSNKIWPSSTDTSWRTTNTLNNEWSGFTNTVFDGPYSYESAVDSHDIDHANEIVQDSGGYIYLFGDRDDIIAFKRSELPDRLDGGSNTNVWKKHPKFELAEYGRLSIVRSSALYDDTCYLAYYEPDNNVIRLASMNLPDWETWDTPTVVWEADESSNYSPRDPGLHVDETGIHVTFVRTDDVTGLNDICYTGSADGVEWSDPVIIRANESTIHAPPIFGYKINDVSVLATVWCEDDNIYTSWSFDDGVSWNDPVLVSTTNEENGNPDLWISDTGNWHFAFASYNPDDELWELHYRRGHLGPD